MIIPTVWSAFYLLWVHVLGLRYPMPFIGLSGYLAAMVITFINIIFWFPKSWHSSGAFRRRRKFFIYVIIYTQVIFFTYFFLEWAFTVISPDYQWVLAISLPIIREGHTYVFGILCSKSAGVQVSQLFKFFFFYIYNDFPEDISSDLIAGNYVNCYHALFLSVMAGGLATSLTVYILLAIDMGLALVFTLQILHYRKKNDTTSLAIAIQSLVLAETVEVTIPVMYTICFMLAYFGPNAEVLGNIKNSYFHYTAVEDVWSSFQMLCIIMCIDLGFLIITFGTLYKFANMNMLKVIQTSIKSLKTVHRLSGLLAPSEGVRCSTWVTARIHCDAPLL